MQPALNKVDSITTVGVGRPTLRPHDYLTQKRQDLKKTSKLNPVNSITTVDVGGPNLRSHEYMIRKRHYVKEASELIFKVTSQTNDDPESQFEEIVRQLDFLKREYFPREYRDYPKYVAINILDLPLFMYNHRHWARYKVIQADRQLFDSLFKHKTNAAWQSLIEFLSKQGVTLPDTDISRGLRRRSVQVADRVQSTPWKTPWTDFECKNLSYQRKVQLEELYTSVIDSYNEISTPKPLSTVACTCNEPPCTFKALLPNAHCQTHCLQIPATRINELITERVAMSLKRQAEDLKEKLYHVITIALVFHIFQKIHLFSTPVLESILKNTELQLPKTDSFVTKTLQKPTWGNLSVL